MFQQVDNPVGGSLAWSALVAALPLLTLFVLLGALRWKAWQAGVASLVVALAVAIFAFGMPAGQALLAASEGAAFGLFPIIWIVLTAIWIFRMTELTGYDLVLRRAFGSLSPDQRIQAIIIAFCFGALLEALAGFGTPVAVTAVMLIAVGISPIKAASVALVANTAPVAFGAIGIPITTLGKITGLDPNVARRHGGPANPDPRGLRPAGPGTDGRRTPRRPADLARRPRRRCRLRCRAVPLLELLLLPGRRHHRGVGRGVGGGAVAAGVAAVADRLLRGCSRVAPGRSRRRRSASCRFGRFWNRSAGSAGSGTGGDGSANTGPVGKGEALMAFAPYLIVVALFAVTSFGPALHFLEAHSGPKFAWPGLEVLNSAGKPLSAATFNLNIFTAGGTVLLVAGILTAAAYRLSVRRAFMSLVGVVVQFKWTILTVVVVLALAYVMNFSGQTVTLGLALAATGGFFAFLSPSVGWIGVAVTGSDTSANSLFGLLQTTAATKTGISPYLLAAANTSGGVLGKMISPQNLAIAAAVVGIEGRESELFRKVVGWSLALLLGICVLVYLQSTPVLGWMVVGG